MTADIRIEETPNVSTTPIALLVDYAPQIEPVLNSFGLDTCCGGHFTVPEACALHGLQPEPVVQALAHVLAAEPAG